MDLFWGCWIFFLSVVCLIHGVMATWSLMDMVPQLREIADQLRRRS